MILKLFSGIASIKKTLIIYSVVFTVGIGTGIWITNKFYAIGKINMLENYIDKQNASHINTVKNLKEVHDEELKIANDNVRIERVTEYVKDNIECNLTVGAVWLLDNSRTGLPNATTRTDEGLSEPSTITQRQQVESCARDGIQYRQLKNTYDGLRRFVGENWK